MRFKQYLFSRTARNTLITLIGTGIFGVTQVVFNILAFRWLGVASFGIFSIATNVAIIGFDILALGTSQAIVRFVSNYLGKGNRTSAEKISSFIFGIRLLEIICLFIAGMFISQFLALKFFHRPDLVIPIFIGLLLSGIFLISEFFSSLFQAREQFSYRSILLIIYGITRLLTLILLASFKLVGIVPFLIAFLAGPLIVSILSYWLTPKAFTSPSLPKEIIAPVFHFSKWMALWGVTASLASRLDVILLGKFASESATGIYAAASRLTILIMTAHGAINTVLEPKTARLIHDLSLLKRNFNKMMIVFTLLSLIIFSLIPLAPLIIPWLLGPTAQPAITIFQVLIIGTALQILTTPAAITLMATGHSKIIGLLSLMQLGVVLGLQLWLIPQFYAFGAAISVVTGFGLVCLIANFSTLKIIRQPVTAK